MVIKGMDLTKAKRPQNGASFGYHHAYWGPAVLSHTSWVIIRYHRLDCSCAWGKLEINYRNKHSLWHLLPAAKVLWSYHQSGSRTSGCSPLTDLPRNSDGRPCPWYLTSEVGKLRLNPRSLRANLPASIRPNWIQENKDYKSTSHMCWQFVLSERGHGTRYISFWPCDRIQMVVQLKLIDELHTITR